MEEELGADRKRLIQEMKMGSAECPFVKSGMSFKEVVDFYQFSDDCTISAAELKYIIYKYKYSLATSLMSLFAGF